jgi:enamine deaminase RidA (YjgF/YER057c/UK114 family)
VYMTDISEFDRMNKIYKSYFSTEKSLATRSTVEAKLVGKFKIEIEIIAYI